MSWSKCRNWKREHVCLGILWHNRGSAYIPPLPICLGIPFACAGGAPFFWSQWNDQSVWCTPGHTHRRCRTLPESSNCPSQDRGSWRSSLAEGPHPWCVLSQHSAKAEGAIQSAIDVDVKKRKVAVLLSLLGELYIPVKASQMITESLQILCPWGQMIQLSSTKRSQYKRAGPSTASAWLLLSHHQLWQAGISRRGQILEVVSSMVTRAEMVLEVSVYSPLNHLTWLLAQEFY